MIGKTIGKYQVIDKIGEGGMGTVYKAEDTTLHRLVALKTLSRSLAEDDEAHERFVREAQAASSINHPNITTVHELIEDEGEHIICMEYVEGKTIRDMAESGRVSVRRAIDICIQTAKALGAAHRKGILHRDVKSANIMVTLDGRVKVMDFGLAHLEERSQLTRTGMTMGTLSYSSPEQITGGLVDQKSEIFSLGIVLYELLTGQLPYTQASEAETVFAIVNNVPPELSTYRSDVSEDLQVVIDRMLEKNPSLRYESMEELVSVLKTIFHDLETTVIQQQRSDSRTRIPRRSVAVISVGLVIAIGAVSIWQINLSSKKRWALATAHPSIRQFLASDQYTSAFHLFQEAERYLPRDEAIDSLWSSLGGYVSIQTDPEAADIWIRDYTGSQGDWMYLGHSPLDSVRIPNGVLRWRVEKEGYQTGEIVSNLLYARLGTLPVLDISLDAEDSVLPGMVRIPSTDIQLSLQGFDREASFHVSAYQMDQCEISNRQFKQFIDDDGYSNRAYWIGEFVYGGVVIPWEEAISEFRDQNGRFGPASWTGGRYPEGEDDYPVRGVSWFEADAYARYVGRSLPTVFHWLGGTSSSYQEYIAPASNYGTEGPVRVDSDAGIGPYGLHNMAGNVREWCSNSVGDNKFILGGGWNDPIYLYRDAGVESPFDRSETNGIRCVLYPTGDIQENERLTAPLTPYAADYLIGDPISPDIFNAYKSMYDYDPDPLDVRPISSTDTGKYWVEERFSFNAAYAEARVQVSLFLPRNIDPPYQVVIYFPGSGAQNHISSDEMQMHVIDFLILNGRAVLCPVMEGTYERKNERLEDPPRAGRAYSEYSIHLVNDVRRSIDYLFTRDDIDTEKIAYWGYSWGARISPVIIAMENRIRVAALLAGGINRERTRPEADEISFLPYSTIPTLMVNGSNDFIFPLETSAKVFFDMMGTPEDMKELLELPAGHPVLATHRHQAISRVLEWFNTYLGPVR